MEQRMGLAVGQKQQPVLIGKSAAVVKVRQLVEKVARSECKVVIEGESGTGKEVVARMIHEKSSRRGGRFIALNCAAIPAALLESELFGHERGSFTDAVKTRNGYFADANDGTLFMDEIGDMSPHLQSKLLRVLQDGVYRRVGGSHEFTTDARVVAATNQNLETAVSEKRFRMDLYYRLAVVTIKIPPLRTRLEDLPLLVEYFLNGGKRLASHATEKLLTYGWPGNVRELQNVLERAAVLSDGEEIVIHDLDTERISETDEHYALAARLLHAGVTVKHAEGMMIKEALRSSANYAEAAKKLGIHRTSLYDRVRRLNLHPLPTESCDT